MTQSSKLWEHALLLSLSLFFYHRVTLFLGAALNTAAAMCIPKKLVVLMTCRRKYQSVCRNSMNRELDLHMKSSLDTSLVKVA